MLASRQRAERNQLLHVVRKGRVAAVLIAARKGRRCNRLTRLRDDLIVGKALLLAILRELCEVRKSRALFDGRPCADSRPAAGRRRHAEHGVDRLPCLVDRGTAIGHVVLVVDDAVALADLLVVLRRVPHVAMARRLAARIRAERDPLLIEFRVVDRVRGDVRHRLAGDRLALALFPVTHDAVGLCEFCLAVVPERGRGDVRVRGEARILCDGGDRLCERAVDVPVRPRLPERIDRRLERMDEGVHIRRGEVGLLVPRRRRQDDVGVERVARHAEIERDEEVELAVERTARLFELCLLTPLDLLRTNGGILLLEDAVLRAEEILEEVVVALR